MAPSVPPPEKPEAVKNRSWIIYSFWAVIIFLGFPTWWQTTSIPRTALPLEDMLTWSDAPETRPLYTVPIRLAILNLPCDTASKIVADTESLLNEKSASWGFLVSVTHVRFPQPKMGGQRVGGPTCPLEEAIPDAHTPVFDIELRPGAAFNLDVSSGAAPSVATYAPQEENTIAPNLAEALQRALSDEKAAVSYQYLSQGRTEPQLLEFTDGLSDETKKSIYENAARAVKSSPGYHLTFSLFTPGGVPSSWDVFQSLDGHVQPLVHALSMSANFSITTQVQLYSAFSTSIQPYQEEGSKTWTLRKNDLAAFVNTAEWPLSPSIGTGPTINFILYIPSKQQTPLRVEGNEDGGAVGGSWVIPQWGGITILNAPIVRNNPEMDREDVIAHLSADLLKPAFDIFQVQLLSLLGVPPSSHISLPLRLKAFQRLTALSLHLRTVSTLGSLARLAEHLSNIPIPRHVSDLVHAAMDNLRAYRADNIGHTRAIAASEGYKASEKAFFDKSMVGQVYFPDEHKVAVYLPLLGPIGVPLIVSLIRQVQSLKARFRP